MRRSTIVVLVVLFSLFTVAAYGQQQQYVSRFDGYVGYSFLTTPNMNLFQNGFDSEFGYNYNRWMALGADFSYFQGSSSIATTMLNTATAAKLLPYAPYLPQPFTVPYDATTYTYTAGPQINIRKIKAVTFFIRPALGAMHQSVSMHPGPGTALAPTLPTLIVQSLVGPGMKTSDTVVFYGFGGGIDFNVSKPMAIRVMSDFVHTGLFTGLLNSGQNTVRFSVSPSFRFGPPVKK